MATAVAARVAAASAAEATAAARAAFAVEAPPAANPAPAWHWQSHAADGLACVVLQPGWPSNSKSARLVSGSKTPLGYHGNELRIAVCAVCSEQKREPTAGELR